MNKKIIRFGLLALALMAGIVFTACDFEVYNSGTLRVQNRSSVTITEINVYAGDTATPVSSHSILRSGDMAVMQSVDADIDLRVVVSYMESGQISTAALSNVTVNARQYTTIYFGYNNELSLVPVNRPGTGTLTITNAVLSGNFAFAISNVVIKEVDGVEEIDVPLTDLQKTIAQSSRESVIKAYELPYGVYNVTVTGPNGYTKTGTIILSAGSVANENKDFEVKPGALQIKNNSSLSISSIKIWAGTSSSGTPIITNVTPVNSGGTEWVMPLDAKTYYVTVNDIFDNDSRTFTITTGNKTNLVWNNNGTLTDNSRPVNSISFSPNAGTLTYVGATRQLVPIWNPSNATNKNVTYQSSNTAVATVSSGGLITAVANGTATITATTLDGNKKAYYYVTVSNYATLTIKTAGAIAPGVTFANSSFTVSIKDNLGFEVAVSEFADMAATSVTINTSGWTKQLKPGVTYKLTVTNSNGYKYYEEFYLATAGTTKQVVLNPGLLEIRNNASSPLTYIERITIKNAAQTETFLNDEQVYVGVQGGTWTLPLDAKGYYIVVIDGLFVPGSDTPASAFFTITAGFKTTVTYTEANGGTLTVGP